jgi:predicted amidohydrolase
MNEPKPTPEPMVRHDGTYPQVPLRSPQVSISVVQTKVRGIDGSDPAPGLKENLEYVLSCIDKAQGYGARSDLLCFHEFPLQGFRPGWDRQAYNRVAIDVPGPETEAIGARAKKYNCYVTFGVLGRHPDWPSHVMNWQVLVGPSGDVVDVHWKPRNVRGLFAGAESFTTSIYDVYDRYVEMYGIDRVIPVTRTDIGNIAMSSAQFEPELFRCMALKGAEIICRVATGGCEWEDMRLTSYHNDVFTTLVNNSVSTGIETSFFEEHAPRNDWVGRSAIFGPRGEVLAEAGVFETKRRAAIDMERYRQRHRIPDVHWTLYRPVMEQYRERYDHSAYNEVLPENGREAAKLLKDRARWMTSWY